MQEVNKLVEHPRNRKIQIRLTEDEYKSIMKKSDTLGIELSSFLRVIALNAKVEIKDIFIEGGKKRLTRA